MHNIRRTAVYAILRTVVWEGGAARLPPIPMCAEHVQQLGGASPLPILMVEKG